MRSSSQPAGKLSLREITLLPLMGALTFAAKEALYALPNVNLNALFFLLATVFFGWKALFSVGIYVLLEGLFNGANGYMLWWFSYLYVWPLLVVVFMLLRKNGSVLLFASAAAIYGLLFGPLMYLVFFAVNGGWEMFVTMWVAGILYDLIHCGSNFITVLVLYPPLYRVMAHYLGPAPFHGENNS